MRSLYCKDNYSGKELITAVASFVLLVRPGENINVLELNVTTSSHDGLNYNFMQLKLFWAKCMQIFSRVFIRPWTSPSLEESNALNL